ncbi:MAG: RDD family protein [Verrucomicrobiales bacterium]
MALGQTTTLDIVTPEGVRFALPLAGPVTRSLAWFIDFLVIVLLDWVASLVMLPLVAVSVAWGAAFQVLVFFLITSLYGVGLEWCWRGQTVGKRVLKLRVMDERGLGLSLAQVVVRNILRAVDSLPLFYVVGGAAMVLTRHCQRLGDLAAGTVVVRTPTFREPRIEGLLAGQYNSFHDHPLTEAQLRQRASPAEAQLVLSALLRRDELTPENRLKVFRELASHFRALAVFPPAVTTPLGDEQYLRNVADSLFRKREK